MCFLAPCFFYNPIRVSTIQIIKGVVNHYLLSPMIAITVSME